MLFVNFFLVCYCVQTRPVHSSNMLSVDNICINDFVIFLVILIKIENKIKKKEKTVCNKTTDTPIYYKIKKNLRFLY